MRILAAHHLSGTTFLHDLDPTPPMRLFYLTRVGVRLGEDLVVEIRFPELPGRVLLRARVGARERGGVWLAFAEEDRSTLDFVVQAARGQAEARASFVRKTARMPVHLRVAVKAEGRAEIEAETEDLSSGGTFVRTRDGLPVGREVSVRIAPEGAEAIELAGVVQWSGRHGMGIRFQAGPATMARRLRAFLRRMHDTGTLA